MKAILLTLLLSPLVLGQGVEDLVGILEDSGWASDYKRDESGVHTSSVSKKPLELKGNRTHKDLNCNNEADQTSIPYKFLLGLMANKSFDISHDPHEGTLTVDGGVMIGNCNSMLETIVSKPDYEAPFYSFQVGVRRPSDCDGGECSYEVVTIENGNNKTQKKKFAPTFAGFVQCLKETEVMKDGKVIKGKVAPLEFLHEERDITQSSELVYANRGFQGTRYAGKFSENKLPNYPGCYYFEDMQKGGFKTYSVDDIQSFELERLYQQVCNSGNYRLINSHIADFDELAPFQTALIDIRNELILKEVTRLHEIVQESETLEEVDKAQFKEVTSDFLEYVIKPLKTDLAQMQRLYANPGHSQKEDILKSIFGPNKAKALLGKDSSELKKILKKEMDEMASELVSMARAPYLTQQDYKKMTDAKAGAPLEDKTWNGTVLDLYEVQLTAFNYGRYSNDFYESHYKDNPKYKNEKRYASASTLDKKVEAKLKDKREVLNRISQVASNPDVDYGARYERTKRTILSDLDRKIAKYRQTMMEAQIKVQTMCSMEKRQKYWINQQACVEEARAKLIACSKQIEALLKERQQVELKYNRMIADWDDASSKVFKSSSRTTASSSKKGSSFTFTPTTTTSRQPQVNNQYSQQLAMMQQNMMNQQGQRSQMNGSNLMGLNMNAGVGMNSQMGMQNNYSSMPNYQMMSYNPYQMGINSGMGMNSGMGFGIGFNAGMGMNSGIGMNSGYGMGYGMGMSNNPAVSYMNPAMSYYGQQQTLPGGSFNFSPSAMSGGSMWNGATSNMYNGAPSTGAPGGFSFGL